MKRTKMNMADLIDNGMDFYRTERLTVPNGTRLTAYFLCDPLTKEQRDLIFSFRNTSTGTSSCPYAPELKRDIVFIYDKNIY